MGDPQAEVRAYYEEEARLRRRRSPKGRRVALRDDFVSLLQREHRRLVLDLGAGPGGDGVAFDAAGCRYVGVDLAHGNARLAAEPGVTVVQATMAALPFRSSSFEAGWSMSALMHLPEDEVLDTVAAMTAPLRAGAPLLIGLWGGERHDLIDDAHIEGQRRLFSLRPFAHNQELIATGGQVERSSRWDMADDGQYHVFLIRVGAR